MRASVIVASHQEGDRLWRTLASCFETTVGLDREVIVADDASFDGSVEEAVCRFPPVRLFRNEERQGASPTKALGARHARGETLVFLDGHCKPEPGAIGRLIEDVEQLKGQAIVTPAIAALDVPRWRSAASQIGHGYFLDLEEFHCGWLPLGELRGVWRGPRKYYESPALIGCALAVGRELYENLGGFDSHMRYWGLEDLDFGLKSWLMGFPILHDPDAVVGHRFRAAFDNFSVPMEHLLANQLRMARKNFTEATWSDWVDRCRARHVGRLPDHPEGLWALAWELFQANRDSVDQERVTLLGHRRHDEFWYAERFGLDWPRLATTAASSLPHKFAADPSGSPPPPPCEVDIDIDGVPDGKEVSLGGLVVRNFDGNNAPRLGITLTTTCASGKVTLVRSNSRIRVFDAATGGNEILFNGTNNVFPVAGLPKRLFVQGSLGSVSMRDTTLTLTHNSGATAKANFTVLWVTVASKHAGAVDNDNSAKPNYVAAGIPQSANLGFRMYYSMDVSAFNSRGSAFIGVVEPADFVPSQFGGAMHLSRSIINGYLYWGPSGNENTQATPAGDDTSRPVYRDDDPQSGGSGGRIYDVDSPGTDAFTQNIMFGFNSIYRKRTNFQEWAVYNNIRCSIKLSCLRSASRDVNFAGISRASRDGA